MRSDSYFKFNIFDFTLLPVDASFHLCQEANYDLSSLPQRLGFGKYQSSNLSSIRNHYFLVLAVLGVTEWYQIAVEI
ncbi:hypothetical protein ACTXT7_007320 [Hymenolepis weldensis]